MTNVNGNYKGGKNLVKYSKTRAFGIQAKAKAQKTAVKIAKSYKTYAGPTVGMFKKTGSAALGTGKFLVKRGLFGFPGLAATGLYYGAKAIAKRQKGLQFSSYRQYNKKGRKII